MSHDTRQAASGRPRSVGVVLTGSDTRDGAGVRLTRFLPGTRLPALDPFLLLDVFRSDDPGDYIAGFPPHPHRGFETVTYLLAGRVRHRDSAGHGGIVKAGGVQWMTAGSGVEHSEMPERDHGMLEGFQLWVNLPAARKMDPPRYQELDPGEIPEEVHPDGTRVRVISGQTARGTRGPVASDTLYLDVQLPSGVLYGEAVPAGHNAFVYIVSGELRVIGGGGAAHRVAARRMATLGEGDALLVEAAEDSRFLLVAGRPIGEPVVRHGPFVMNSVEQIEQAYRDYRDGRFGKVEDDGVEPA